MGIATAVEAVDIRYFIRRFSVIGGRAHPVDVLRHVLDLPRFKRVTMYLRGPGSSAMSAPSVDLKSTAPVRNADMIRAKSGHPPREEHSPVMTPEPMKIADRHRDAADNTQTPWWVTPLRGPS